MENAWNARGARGEGEDGYSRRDSDFDKVSGYSLHFTFMPTYEYECTKCGHRFERFQRITEEPVKRCPKCRCKVRRLFGTGVGILFKGGGFYETDYRSESYKQALKKERESAKPVTEKKEAGKATPVKPDNAATKKAGKKGSD